MVDARQILAFSLILLGAGAAAHYFDVTIWPWVLYGIGAFALLLAEEKWRGSGWRFCPKRNYSIMLRPWSKE